MKRTQHMLVLAAIALLSLATAACHSSRRTAATPRHDATPEEAAPQRRAYSIIPFTAEAEGLTVSGQVRLAHDSCLWVSISKYIEVGRGLALADSVFFQSALMGSNEATDYAGLRKRTGVHTSLAELQTMLLAPDADRRIADLARRLGYTLTVHLGQRRQVETLTFPYTHTAKKR